MKKEQEIKCFFCVCVIAKYEEKNGSSVVQLHSLDKSFDLETMSSYLFIKLHVFEELIMVL